MSRVISSPRYHVKWFYFPSVALLEPLHREQTLFPVPWQLGQDRWLAFVLDCLPCPRQTGQVMDPLPLHAGQGSAVVLSAICYPSIHRFVSRKTLSLIYFVPAELLPVGKLERVFCSLHIRTPFVLPSSLLYYCKLYTNAKAKSTATVSRSGRLAYFFG